MRATSASLLFAALVHCTGDVPVGTGHDTLVDCRTDPESTGCPCDAEAPVACYDGPDSTVGVGTCLAGMRICSEGHWGACEGQVLPAEEVCNEADDDCDGDVDQNVLSECGLCGRCEQIDVGIGGDRFFETDWDCTTGLDGSLQRRYLEPRGVLWLVQWDSVIRVDTTTRTAVAAVRLGDDVAAASHAAVGTAGEVYVSSQHGSGPGTIERVLAADCRDQDRDGTVETSTGPGDLLPLGEDECRDWQIEVGAQRWAPNPIAYVETPALDGGRSRAVWVGLAEDNQLVEVDADQGELTGRSVDAPACWPTVMLTDAEHAVWVGCETEVLRLDPVNEALEEQALAGGLMTRAIARDERGRLWLGSGGGSAPIHVCDWASGDCEEVLAGANTLVADHAGSVWAGGCTLVDEGGAQIGPDWRSCRFGVDDLAVAQVDVATESVDVATDGFVWAIGGEVALAEVSGSVLDPANLSIEPVLEDCPECFVNLISERAAYTDRDTLGARPCAWRQVFSSCAAEEATTWSRLRWDTDVAAEQRVALSVRAADTAEALETSAWIEVQADARDQGTTNIRALLGDEANRAVLEVKADLHGSAEPGPTLRAIGLDVACQ